MIDEDEVIKVVNKHLHRGKLHPLDTLDKDIFVISENVPTAFDVEKVVEELKNAKDEDGIVCCVDGKPVRVW